MDQKQATPEKGPTTEFPVLYVAFELGNSTWKMSLSNGRRVRNCSRAIIRESWPRLATARGLLLFSFQRAAESALLR